MLLLNKSQTVDDTCSPTLHRHKTNVPIGKHYHYSKTMHLCPISFQDSAKVTFSSPQDISVHLNLFWLVLREPSIEGYGTDRASTRRQSPYFFRRQQQFRVKKEWNPWLVFSGRLSSYFLYCGCSASSSILQVA